MLSGLRHKLPTIAWRRHEWICPPSLSCHDNGRLVSCTICKVIVSSSLKKVVIFFLWKLSSVLIVKFFKRILGQPLWISVRLSFFLIWRRFSRKGRWSSAQVWFDYSELFETRIVSFLSLYALSRKIEVVLLSLNTCRVTKSQSALDQMKKQITRVRQILALGYEIIISQNETKLFPFLSP